MTYEFRLPDIGEGIHEGEIVRWLIQAGDTVREDQSIVEIMTDKVTAEIPSPVSGIAKELRGKEGEVITVGSVIVVFDTGKSTAAALPQESKTEEAKAEPAKSEPAVETPQQVPQVIPANAVPADAMTKVLAAPATRKLARQLGIDLATITGTGPHGRITPDDVQGGQGQATAPQQTQQPKANTPPASQPAPKASNSPFVLPTASSTGSQPDKRVPFAGMRRKIAEHLVKSKQTAPHFAYVEEVDMTELVKWRKDLKAAAEDQGVKLTYLPFIIQAVSIALREFPVLNSQLDESTQELVYKGDINIGVATAVPDGLVVPVVKHADQKSILHLATEIQQLSEKARSGKLATSDLQGGTFTLTSIGSIGGLFGIPIINVPEVAIMGINKITPRPVVRDGEIVIRDIMHLSLSGDHRVVDGAEAAQFTKAVIEILETPARLILKG